MGEDGWITLVPASEIEDGTMLGFEIGDLHLALYHVGGQFHATDNICTHAFALLTDGWLEGHVIECPLHGGQFDVTTGAALCEPAECALKTWPVRVANGEVQVDLSSSLS